MNPDTLAYLDDAIRRVGSGQISSDAGSHMAGVFGKAATGFEKEVSSFASLLLRVCGVEYDTRVRPEVHGKPFHKLTLGELAVVINVVRQISSDAGRFNAVDLNRLLRDLRAINSTWVQVKHGEDSSPEDLRAGLIAMRRALNEVRRLTTGSS
jgi:hypothetical protein